MNKQKNRVFVCVCGTVFSQVYRQFNIPLFVYFQLVAFFFSFNNSNNNNNNK